MRKYVKMALYADPGVGKSTFASKAPNVFFITTDGNFQWLNLPNEQHVEITNWNQFLKISELLPTEMFDWCDTIVIDLLEDTYKYCEDDFCKVNKIQHIGDMDWGKGYAIVKDQFTIAISKIIGLPKNVIMLLHAYDDTSKKDARGNTVTKHLPSNRIPDKVLDIIEGRVNFFLRAYTKSEVSAEDDRLIKKRYLSLVPKANEYGIIRQGENEMPTDIDLDWETFAEVVGLNEDDNKSYVKTDLQRMLDEIKPSTAARGARPTVSTTPTTPVVSTTPRATTPTRPTAPTAPVKTAAPQKPVEEKKVEEKKVVVEDAKAEELKLATDNKEEILAKLNAKDKAKEATEKMEEVNEKPETIFDKAVEEVEVKPAVQQSAKVTSEKSNDIAAKLAALKAAKNKK